MAYHENIRILIIDDEAVVREPLADALGWLGYAPDTAATVDDALLQLSRAQFDLIICDLVMPDAHGFTLLEILRRQYPEIPAIVLTGHGTVDLAQKAIQLGAQDFVTKPFHIHELPFLVERNLERKRLERHLLEQRNEYLLFQTIQALTAAIEAKDPYTAGHSQKVAQLALQFSQVLELDDTDVFVLRLAGVMHDIGKIGIPENVLLKPGKLSEYEWEIMKQHPVIGAEIVGRITDLGFVAKVVRSHHERWDGKGYPDGLRGDAIPLLSRILGISDVYDALTADRAYRAGMTHEQAIRIIREQVGSHFELELVDMLEEVVLPSFGKDWHDSPPIMPYLSRTSPTALSVQTPVSLS